VEQGAGQGTGAAATAAEVPWRRLFRTILPVTAVDFCYGWTLWLFLSWIPSFFLRNYHLDLKQSAAFSAGVFFAGVIGDTLGGILSDRLLRRTGRRLESRRRVIILGFAGGLLFLAPVVLVHDLTVAAVCLSLAFFFVELIVAPIWAVPMDLAPDNAATASGMMNLGFGIAGIISPLIFGLLVDLTGSWAPPFLASMGLMAAGIGLCFLIPQPARRPVMAPASPARTVPAARPAGQA
jgi:MFS family permease